MKTCIYRKYGSPEVLEFAERDEPLPKYNEVLVKVHASSINDWDWQLLQGVPLFNRLSNGFKEPKKITTLGCDVAGVISAVGDDVTGFKPGDEVYGDLSGCGFGAFAEYVCAREDALVKKPVELSFEQAASLPQAGIIALQGFEFAGAPKTGLNILINGASGGVGPLAIQLAKHFQATEITGVCSAEKVDFVYSLGADHVIDYTSDDFTKQKKSYDLILDVKGFHHFLDYKKVLSTNGVYALQGGGTSIIFETLFMGWAVNLFSKKKMGIQIHKANKGMDTINDLVKSDHLKPVVDKIFSFSELPQAMSYYGSGKARGKVVITMEH